MNRLSTLTRLDARAPTRVGRGGKRGKTSGKGTKGQNARAGHHKRPELRDIIKKFPKLRGHGKNRARTVNDARLVSKTVSLMAIEKAFKAGETVSPKTLVEKRVVVQRGKKLPDVVIVATGSLTKSVTVEKVRFSVAAKAAIEKAGGSVK
jgi:large subunit ribosomal protein L15